MALGWLWWRAWAGISRRWRRGILRGRRGTCRHPLLFHMTGVLLGDTYLHFAWQAWCLWHWAASGGAVGLGLVAGDALSFCVAGVTLDDIHVASVALGDRQAWRLLWHWDGSGGALGLGLVAGDAMAFCVAGVALGDIHLRFPWQAWHLATSTFVSRGRRATYGTGTGLAGDAVALGGRRGTWRHAPSFRLAGVALGDMCFRFTWQAWHLWHWAGSGGTLGLGLVAGDAAALCVAGVALGDIHLRFTWQARHLATYTCTLRGRRGAYGTGLTLVVRLDWD